MPAAAAAAASGRKGVRPDNVSDAVEPSSAFGPVADQTPREAKPRWVTREANAVRALYQRAQGDQPVVTRERAAATKVAGRGAPEEGIEPSFCGSKPRVLPLDDSGMAGSLRAESNRRGRTYEVRPPPRDAARRKLYRSAKQRSRRRELHPPSPRYQ